MPSVSERVPSQPIDGGNETFNEMFKHTPLSLEPHSIRLVRVLPDFAGERLQCEIRQATTEDEYSCISYVWGKPCERRILLNGFDFTMRANLHDFLSEAHHHNLRSWLWIDAICIDQRNTAERNHQVQHFASIYKSASRVIIWLGAEQRFLREATERKITQYEDFVQDTGKLSRRTAATRSLDGVAESADLQKYHPFLHELCTNQYFERVWTMQEFLVARDPLMWWGHDQLPIARFLAVVKQEYNICLQAREMYYSNDSGSENEASSKFRTQLMPTNAREGSRWISNVESSLQVLGRVQKFVDFQGAAAQPSLSLLDIIVLLKPSQCTDVRDRVYALLSLASDGASFKVDYREDIARLYDRLIRHGQSNLPEQLTEKFFAVARCLGLDDALVYDRLFSTDDWDSRSVQANFHSGPHILPDESSRMQQEDSFFAWTLGPPLSIQKSISHRRPTQTDLDSKLPRRPTCAMCAAKLKFVAPSQISMLRLSNSTAPALWISAGADPLTSHPRLAVVNIQNAALPIPGSELGQRLRVSVTRTGLRQYLSTHWLLISGSGVYTSDIKAVILGHCALDSCALSLGALLHWDGASSKSMKSVADQALHKATVAVRKQVRLYCYRCGDGPYGSWQVACQICHTPLKLNFNSTRNSDIGRIRVLLPLKDGTHATLEQDIYKTPKR